MFSQAQYQAVTAKVIGGANEMGAKIQQFPPVANRVIMYAPLPDTVKEAIRYLTEKIISLLRQALDKIVEVLKGIAAPVFMYFDSGEWQDISVLMTGMTNGIRSAAEGIPAVWKGAASEAYVRSANAQAAATERVAAIMVVGPCFDLQPRPYAHGQREVHCGPRRDTPCVEDTVTMVGPAGQRA